MESGLSEPPSSGPYNGTPLTDLTVDDSLTTPTPDNGNNNLKLKNDLNQPLTLEPYTVPHSSPTVNEQNLDKNFNCVVYIPNIPSNYDFQSVLMMFSNKKNIEGIKMDWQNGEKCWETWITFSSPCEATFAHTELSNENMTCQLKNKSPCNLEA